MTSLPTLDATTRRARPWRTRLTAWVDGDVLVVAILLGVGVLAWGSVFGSAVGYAAAGLGVLGGLLVQVVGRARGWTVLTRMTALILLYLAAGGPVVLPGTTVAGVLPTLETVQRLTLLSFGAWRDLLTVGLPAGQFEGPAAAPLIAGLAAGSVTLALARLPRFYWLAILAAGLFLVAGIMWGSRAAPWAAAQGVAFASVALAWASARTSRVERDDAVIRFGPGAERPRAARRLAPGAVVLAVASLIGVVLAPAMAGDARWILRDQVTPPLDLQEYPSPLTGFRDLETTRKDDALLKVSGLPEGSRLRLATMDLYDGNVYNVSESAALFSRAGQEILPTSFSDRDAPVRRLDIAIAGYEGVWLPGGGDLRGIVFEGPGADAQGDGLYVNPATGTALTTAGVEEGTSYSVEVALPPARPEELPADAAPTEVVPPPEQGRFEELSSVSADLSGDAASATEQAATLSRVLSRRGFFADGTKDESLAGHSTERIRLLLASATGQMVGDDEQYAVGMALMARELGLPARVVMGFYPERWAPGTLTITGDDAHVWTEVAFDGLGWVPFDPTPDDDRRPDNQRPKPLERNDPQVLPPPEVPDEEDKRAPAKAQSEQNERDEDDTSNIWPVLRAVGIGMGGAALVTSPLWLALLLKARRRQRRRAMRRPADRISGGWSELTDVARDLGRPMPSHATRRELAPVLASASPSSDETSLASTTTLLRDYAGRVDARVFGTDDPTPDDASELWLEAESARRALLRSLPLRHRLRAGVSWRSLRRSGTAGWRRRA